MSSYQLFRLYCKIAILNCVFGLKNKTVLKVGFLSPGFEIGGLSKDLLTGFMVGLKKVDELQILRDFEVQYGFRFTNCDSKDGMRAAVDLRRSMGSLSAIIGDSCSSVCQPVALLSSAWDIPTVSNICTSDALSDPKTFPTFTRVIGVYKQYTIVFLNLIKAFKWNIIGLITNTIDLFKGLADDLKSALETDGILVHYYSIQSLSNSEVIFEGNINKVTSILKELKNKARIIIVLLYDLDTRIVLSIAHDEGMLDGDYVFFSSEANPLNTNPSYYRPELRTEYLYQGWLRIQNTFDMSEEFDTFRKDCFQVAEELKQKKVFNVINLHNERPMFNTALVYDAVLALAYGLNKTIMSGEDFTSGLVVTSHIINLTFQGMTGTVVIGPSGDRSPDYVVQMFQNGHFIEILKWKAASKEMIKLYKADSPDDWNGLLWAGNGTSVPLDCPRCGWHNELCTTDHKETNIVLICVLCLFCIMAIALMVIIAHKRIRQGIQLKEAEGFIISSSELELLSQTLGTLSLSKLSVRSEQSTLSGRNRSTFTKTALWKGTTAAIKSLQQPDLSHDQKTIVQHIRIIAGIKHNNVNTFCAICLESPSILMTYTMRGSLQDVLFDETVKLTWDFKSSFIEDIARGMKYLHASAIGFHGHLTSSNCLVDSRWTCKVTDYGFPHLRTALCQQPVYKLLWVAPEILRDNTGPVGSREGDVFSYGIILQEILLEDGPYCLNLPSMEPVQIVERVKIIGFGVYRPEIATANLSSHWKDLMQQCWEEEPFQRPTFGKIVNTLRLFNNGLASNLVQNMLKKLENHANNLEVLVDERTRSLHEEKDKLEQLLEELLPKNIVEVLAAGRMVTPEVFDSCTIFFSDIAEFTRISAAGTPADVVKMLNTMYTFFDDVTTQFDVYKVATIGDAYFVVSGVPIRNGDRHADQICKMALALQEVVGGCPVPHLPGERLRMRIGVHSGPCVAGVTGVKMPRYLLFGDTVDTAQHMESNGEVMQLHVSQATVDMLSHDAYVITARADRPNVPIKGIDNQPTYWLQKKAV